MNEEHATDQELLETLRELEFLRGIDDEHLKELAKICEFVDFPEATIIFRSHGDASRCYLIVDGRVLLEICGSAVGCKPVLTLGGGELLGWSPVLGQALLSANARTLTATRAIAISGSQLVTLCEQAPEFGYQFMRCTALALAKRLTATRLQLLDLYGTESQAIGEHG